VDGSKIKIEHPGEPGTFLSREYTSAELAQFAPDALAKALLDGYAGTHKNAWFKDPDGNILALVSG
jgi:hypothetical protein